MRKFLTTGLFGAILGLLVGAPADASLISRSFLDQALTDYATTTALDLKANQSDFTELSNKIGDAWPYWSDMSPGLISLSWGLYPLEITLENVSDLVRFLFGGALESGINQGGVLNLLGESVVVTGAYDINTGQIDDGFRSLLQLTNGWTDSEKKTYLGVKGLNDKIGTLPEGITVQGMYEGWVGNNGLHTLGLQELELDSFYTYNPENDSPQLLKGQKGGLLYILSNLLGSNLLGDYGYSLDGVELAPFWKLTQSAYKTDELSAKIGTLPSGSLLNVWGGRTDGLYKNAQRTDTPVYPTSLEEFVLQIYGIPGTPLGVVPSLVAITDGLKTTANTANETATAAKTAADANTTKIGTVPDGKNLAGMISETDAKIGTLPSGSLLRNSPATDFLFMYTQNTDTPVFPNSLSDLINQLYGNSETGAQGLLAAIITGFPIFDTDGDGSPDEPIGLIQNFQSAGRANNLAKANATKIGTVPDGKNLAGMISETDAKIGTLPTEYATVGAALTAIKGIAEDAKAAALAAIPDPKTEGSTGKYVLTVDIVGDNATYRWEKIDREGETTTTTE